MGDLSTQSLKQDAVGMHDRIGYIPEQDRTEIVFNEGSKIEGRKPGTVYTVDSSLAHHYCEVLKVARKVEAPPAPKEKKDDPPPITDRAVKAPPRGRN